MLRQRLWASVKPLQRGIAACSFFAIVCTTATFEPASAQTTGVSTTVTPIRKAPYSKVFFTGTVYAVKDHDFKSDNPSMGFSTVWFKKPSENSLQLNVRYCLPQDSVAQAGAQLTQMVLGNNNQPLVTINQRVKTTPTTLRVLRPGYYSYAEGIDDDLWDDGFLYQDLDLSWGGDPDGLGFSTPVYVPPISCSVGTSRFNISQLTTAIAQLPLKTLQVTLVFSNGETSNWKLGDKTVKALKELIAISNQLPSSPKSSSAK
ncbi:hypothetical protein [Nostoc sp.]|uniref:hypothetical protein n=1 Tax=Nostoc sp. TaxID=1180 RepID=UPI002FF4DCC6